LPEKALIANELQQGGNYCAIGAVGVKRGVDMSNLDPDDAATVSGKFDIAEQMAQEIVYENDENTWNFAQNRTETSQERWLRMRAWAVANLNKEK
jgi:nitrate/TMAO reductase-like tetraheme cytochrome c subunit